MDRDPLAIETLVQFRIARIGEERRACANPGVSHPVVGWTRRQVGRLLISLGERLSGPVAASPSPRSRSEEGRLAAGAR